MRSSWWPGFVLAALALPGLAGSEDIDEVRRKEGNASFSFESYGMVKVLPDAARETVGPVKPPWCDKVQADPKPRKNRVAGRITRTMKSGIGESNVAFALKQFCDFPDDAEFQKQLGYLVQIWVNRTGLTKSEALAALTARIDNDAWEAAKQQDCRKHFQTDEEASEEEKEINWARRTLFGCTNNFKVPYYNYRNGGPETEWYIDKTSNPATELDRLYYALHCLPPASAQWDKNTWLAIGLCGPDIRALDRAKVEKETAKMGEPFRLIARESVAHAKGTLAQLEEDAKAKVDSDPDYKKVIYTAPKAAWSAWEADYKANKAGMDATFAFEQELFGPRASAVKGCWGRVEAGLLKYVKQGKFKSQEQFVEGIQSGVGYSLFNALGTCYAVTAPSWVGRHLVRLNSRSKPWRGPRIAARYAMIDALNDVKADRTKFPVSYSSFGQMGYRNHILDAANNRSKQTPKDLYEETQGVVKKVKKLNKEDLLVTFKTESWMEEQHVCKETNRVDRIDSNGRVVYRRKCRSTGKKKQTFTPKPVILHSWASKGVKPNAFLKFAVPAGSGYGKQQRRGYPVEVYKTKRKKKLVNMHGFAL